MWRIETSLDDTGAPYDSGVAAYDRIVRSRTYNRMAWSSSLADYSRFASTAFAASSGPLQEVAAGSAAATADLHAGARRPTVLLDLSRPMLERAAARIASAAAGGEVPSTVRLVEADLFEIPPGLSGFPSILGRWAMS